MITAPARRGASAETPPLASHEQRRPDGERALDDDEAQQIRVERRPFRAGNDLPKA